LPGFNIVAQVQLQGPTNIAAVAQQISSGLSNISANVNVNVNNASLGALQGLGNTIGQLNTSLGALVNASNTASGAVSNLGGSMSRTSAGASVVQQSARTATTSLKSVTTAFQEAEAAGEQFGKSAGLALRRFAGFTLAAGTVFAVVDSFKHGIEQAILFEREMNKLEQVNAGTVTQIKEVERAISSLSTTFGASSQSLAQAAVLLGSAGLKADDVTKSLEALAKSAASPQFGNLIDTTNGVIAIMSQFKVPASEIEKSLGAINSVSNAFSTESGDLIEAIKRSGGAFRATGGDLNEFLALFTSVRATTRESAESIATGLRTIFTRFQTPQTVNALKEMGINLRFSRTEAEQLGKVNLTDQFVGPYEAVRRLSTALKDLPTTDPRFSAIIDQLGGYRQISRVIPLIQEFGTAQRAYATAQSGALSITAASEKAQESYAVQIAKTKETFLELTRTIVGSEGFRVFLDGLLKIANAAVILLNALGPLIPLLTTLAAIRIGAAIPGFIAGFAGGFRGEQPKRLAIGGVVPGVGNTDTVPAMLTPGEFVVRKESAQRIGYSNLSKLNSGGQVKVKDGIQYLAEGGIAVDIDGSYGGLFLRGKGSTKDYSAYSAGSISSKKLEKILDNDSLRKRIRSELHLARPQGQELGLNLTVGNEGYKINDVLANGATIADVPVKFAGSPGVHLIDPNAARNFNTIIEQGVRTAVITSTRTVLDSAGIKSDNSTVAAFKAMKENGLDSVIGHAFEATLVGIAGSVGERTTPGEYFDFKNVDSKTIQGLSQLFSNVNESYLDVKATASSGNIRSLVGKAINTLSEGSSDFSLSYNRARSENVPALIREIETNTNNTRKRLQSKAPSVKLARGGIVPGVGDTDSVPAQLMPGEFVIRKSSAQKIGYDTLSSLNNFGGQIRKFEQGGNVYGKDISDANIAQAEKAFNDLFGSNVKFAGLFHRLLTTSGNPGIYGQSVASFFDKSKVGLLSEKAGIETIAHESAHAASLASKDQEGKDILPTSDPNSLLGKFAKASLNTVYPNFRSKKYVEREAEKYTKAGLPDRVLDEALANLIQAAALHQLGRTDDPRLQRVLADPQSVRVLNLVKPLLIPELERISKSKIPLQINQRSLQKVYEVHGQNIIPGLPGLTKRASGGPVRMAVGGETFKFGAKSLTYQELIDAGLSTEDAKRLQNFEKVGSGKVGSYSKPGSKKIEDRVLHVPLDPSEHFGMIYQGDASTAGLDVVHFTARKSLPKLSVAADTFLSKYEQVDPTNPAGPKLPLDGVLARIDKHVVSQRTKSDFNTRIQGKVESYLNQLFKSEFPSSAIPLNVDKKTLSDISGGLFENYVEGISQVEKESTTNATFDFVNSRIQASDLNKVVYPHIRTGLLDVKFQGANSAPVSVTSKYINYKVAQGADKVIPTARLGLAPDEELGPPLTLNERTKKNLEETYRKLGLPIPAYLVRSLALLKASGGSISDTVPALLTPGEFVINRDSASRIGLPQLNLMNTTGKVRGFAKGGEVQKFATGDSVDNPIGDNESRLKKAKESISNFLQEIVEVFSKDIPNVLKNILPPKVDPNDILKSNAGYNVGRSQKPASIFPSQNPVPLSQGQFPERSEIEKEIRESKPFTGKGIPSKPDDELERQIEDLENLARQQATNTGAPVPRGRIPLTVLPSSIPLPIVPPTQTPTNTSAAPSVPPQPPQPTPSPQPPPPPVKPLTEQETIDAHNTRTEELRRQISGAKKAELRDDHGQVTPDFGDVFADEIVKRQQKIHATEVVNGEIIPGSKRDILAQQREKEILATPEAQTALANKTETRESLRAKAETDVAQIRAAEIRVEAEEQVAKEYVGLVEETRNFKNEIVRTHKAILRSEYNIGKAAEDQAQEEARDKGRFGGFAREDAQAEIAKRGGAARLSGTSIEAINQGAQSRLAQELIQSEIARIRALKLGISSEEAERIARENVKNALILEKNVITDSNTQKRKLADSENLATAKNLEYAQAVEHLTEEEKRSDLLKAGGAGAEAGIQGDIKPGFFAKLGAGLRNPAVLGGLAYSATSYLPGILNQFKGGTFEERLPGQIGPRGELRGDVKEYAAPIATSAATGIISGLGAGSIATSLGAAALGTAAVPIIGIVAGLGVGLLALTSSLHEQEKQIKSAQLGKALDSLALKINDFNSGKLFGGEAGFSVVGREFQNTERLRRSEDITSRAYGFGLFTDNTPQKVTSTEEKSLREKVLPQLPGLLQAQEKVLGDIFTRQNAGNVRGGTALNPNQLQGQVESVLADFLKAGDGFGKQILETTARLKNVPYAEVERETKQQIIAIQNSARVVTNELQARALLSSQLNSLVTFTNSLNGAIISLKEFDDKLSLTGQIVSGNVTGGQVNVRGDVTQAVQSGDPDTLKTVLNSSLGILGSRLDTLREPVSQLNRAYRDLPNILTQAGSSPRGPLEAGTFGDKVATLLQGQNFGREITTAITSALDTQFKDPAALQQALTKDIGGLSKELLKSYQPLLDAISNISKAVEGETNKFISNLSQSSRFLEEVNAGLQQQSNLQLQRARVVAESQAIQAGRRGDTGAFLSLQQLEAPFNALQQRLSGINGPGAFNPDVISQKLDKTNEELRKADEERRNFIGTPRGDAGAVRFEELGRESNNLQKSLKNLADVSSRAAGVQEKLTQLQADRESRLSFGERVITADPAQQAQIQRGLALINITAQRRSAEGLTQPDLRLLFETIHSLGQTRLPVAGNVTAETFGKDLVERIGTSIFPKGTFTPQAGAQNEETQLRKTLTGYFDTGIKSSEKLVQQQNKGYDKFIQDLTRSHNIFLARLEQIELSTLQSTLENQKRQADVEKGLATNQNKAATDIIRITGISGRGAPDQQRFIDAVLQNQNEIRKYLELQSRVTTNTDPRVAAETIRKSLPQRGLPSDIKEVSNFFGDKLYRPDQDKLVDRVRDVVTKNISNLGLSVKDVEPITAAVVKRLPEFPSTIANRPQAEEKYSEVITSIPNILANLKEVTDLREIQQNEFNALQNKLIEALTGGKPELKAPAEAALKTFPQISPLLSQFQSGEQFVKAGERLTAATASFDGFDKQIKKVTTSLEGINERLNNLNNPPQTSPQAPKPQIPVFRPVGRASGGIIAGSGISSLTRGTDTIPAMLTPGEFVVRREAVQQHLPLLLAINGGRGSGDISYFQYGGLNLQQQLGQDNPFEKFLTNFPPSLRTSNLVTRGQSDQEILTKAVQVRQQNFNQPLGLDKYSSFEEIRRLRALEQRIDLQIRRIQGVTRYSARDRALLQNLEQQKTEVGKKLAEVSRPVFNTESVNQRARSRFAPLETSHVDQFGARTPEEVERSNAEFKALRLSRTRTPEEVERSNTEFKASRLSRTRTVEQVEEANRQAKASHLSGTRTPEEVERSNAEFKASRLSRTRTVEQVEEANRQAKASHLSGTRTPEEVERSNTEFKASRLSRTRTVEQVEEANRQAKASHLSGTRTPEEVERSNTEFKASRLSRTRTVEQVEEANRQAKASHLSGTRTPEEVERSNTEFKASRLSGTRTVEQVEEANRQAKASHLSGTRTPQEIDPQFTTEDTVQQYQTGRAEREARIKKLYGYALGGFVGNTDTVPAMLTPGEYVLNRATTAKIGVNNLNKVNYMQEGGVVTGGANAGGSLLSADAIASISNFSGAATGLSRALTTFNGNSEGLTSALKAFPKTITGTFTHNVNVNHNGLEILNTLTPSISEIALRTVNRILGNYIRQNLPGAPPLNEENP
jgi:TP901 family phage tail tape measure protein